MNDCKRLESVLLGRWGAAPARHFPGLVCCEACHGGDAGATDHQVVVLAGEGEFRVCCAARRLHDYCMRAQVPGAGVAAGGGG